MSEQQSTGSAWPAPPKYYKRYTPENINQLKDAQKSGVYPDAPVSQPPLPDFYLQSLEPPPRPTDAYTVFDQNWKVQDRLPTLDELGVKQLFPSTGIDRVQELKKLNRVLITQFLDLLDVLIKNPEEFGTRIEHISMVFINMHHILNEYRPHQARETLRLLMENQVERKRKETAALKSKTDQIKHMLQNLGDNIVLPDIEENSGNKRDTLVEPQEKDESTDTQDVDMLGGSPAENGISKDELLMSMIDEIV